MAACSRARKTICRPPTDGQELFPLVTESQIRRESESQRLFFRSLLDGQYGSSFVRSDHAVIHMMRPYSWRPPSYWFDPRFAAARGSCAEQGDNEHIPPYESLKKFIPPDKLWPINEYWYFHAGATEGNNRLATIRRVIDQRYGPSQNAEEFADKAQMAHYEATRAQFEGFGAGDWANHKMTLYWMLNNQWPSFFGHLLDYYLEPGGAYFGAKKALRPLSVVYDHYAADGKEARIFAVNRTLTDERGLRVSVEFYNLNGSIQYSADAKSISASGSSVQQVLRLPRIRGLSPIFFVRCQLWNSSGALLVDNVYWDSITGDDPGDPSKDPDHKFDYQPKQWASFSGLITLPRADLDLTARDTPDVGGESETAITLTNRTAGIAFFIHVGLTKGQNGTEILPVTYEDNYVTVFPHESVTIHARYKSALAEGKPVFVELDGRNVSPKTAAVTRPN